MAPVTRSLRQVSVQPDSNHSDERCIIDSTNAQPDTSSGTGSGHKRKRNKRGPTFMCKIWGMRDGELLRVKFNKNGQPIRGNSTLGHFLGTIARNGKLAPLNYKSWSLMPEENKEAMVKVVLEKFDIPIGHKCWILASINKKRRNWKTTVKNDHFDLNIPIEEQMSVVPDRVHADQWKELVKMWHEKEVKALSEKNKATRRDQTIIYRGGKTSLAVIKETEKEKHGCYPSRADLFINFFTKDGFVSNDAVNAKIAKMRDLSSQLPEDENDHVGPNDVFSQAMGAEKPGRVRMCGLGVCPSDVWGTIPSRGASYRMAMQWKEELDKTNNALQKTNNEVQELMAIVTQQAANVVTPTVTPTVIPNAHPNQPRGSTLIEHHHIKVGDFVSLKSLASPTDIVGKGRVNSIDPSTMVGLEELGPNWCEVQVQVPVKRDEHLMRPYGGLKTMMDAIGAPVVWPLCLVEEDEDY